MGKKQHQGDKLYLTCTEWKTYYGGKKPDRIKDAKFKRLPFDHCSLSLQPFEHPLCTSDGVIYDLMSIVPYLKKYGTDPISGKPLQLKSLVKMLFHKNQQGKFHCPVTYKVFTNTSHMACVGTTGHVYNYEAIEELNLKPKYFKDLLTNETFAKTDIIVLQDPNNLEKFNIANFHHVQKNLKAVDEEDMTDPMYYLRAADNVTKDVLKELYKGYETSTPSASHETTTIKKADKLNAAAYSTGTVAAGFTSTVMAPVTEQESAIIDEDIVRYKYVKKKAYVRVVTNLGDLNLELHSDMVPKVCENFVKLCSNGYYKGTVFHRSIKNFMVQGGDPTGTGKGGESAWGKPFDDHFKPNLTHTGRGVLSMANSGPDTNKSQFFITYRSCVHLNGKHTVFGRVVGGMDTLSAMEKIPTDIEDRPTEEIKIIDTSVFINPYDDADEIVRKLRESEPVQSSKSPAPSSGPSGVIPKTIDVTQIKSVRSQGVGKYIKTSVVKRQHNVTAATDVQTTKHKKLKSSGFNNW